MSQLKNIVIFCDGTANQVSIYTHTNIVRIAGCLDKVASVDKRQVVFYDPGVGTEGSPAALTLVGRVVTKVLGLMFGYGLSKSLRDAYAFLMQNYEPGDQIFIFGFSRGAYTARALTGLLGRVGLLERGCESLIPYAIKYYHKSNDHQLNFFKKRFSRTYALNWEDLTSKVKDENLKKKPSKGVIPVHFLGVWDTVKSIGVLRWQVTLPDTEWLPNMVYGRHAVAKDEKRSQYRPVLWESDTNQNHQDQKDNRKSDLQTCLHRCVQTKWFTGAHADVGGGYGLPLKLEKELIKIKLKIKQLDWNIIPLYKNKGDYQLANIYKKKKRLLLGRQKEIEKREKKETELAYVSLNWMLDAAEKQGLLLDTNEVAKIRQVKVSGEKHHNSLIPCWWILGWWKRRVPEGEQIQAKKPTNQ